MQQSRARSPGFAKRWPQSGKAAPCRHETQPPRPCNPGARDIADGLMRNGVSLSLDRGVYDPKRTPWADGCSTCSVWSPRSKLT